MGIAPAHQNFNFEIIVTLALVALIFAVVIGAFLFIRRSMREDRRNSQDPQDSFRVNSENPSAFMTASMQGVIARLREQEQELARLHQVEKERAQET
ncbi:MAG TPA: hypothetical protein VFD93_06475, partial [Candidatus Acidoferrales bacterium]|nr:hypothetical protein [Candidatus Acidoferrales bacterium]